MKNFVTSLSASAILGLVLGFATAYFGLNPFYIAPVGMLAGALAGIYFVQKELKSGESTTTNKQF